MKEFSVLISVYAREQSDYLRSALHSVFEQTVPPTEVVLVEDGPSKTSNGSFQLEYDTSSLLLKPLSTYRIHITNKAVVGYQYQDRK